MVGILFSVGMVAAGLYLTVMENNTEMGLIGAMLLVLGVTFLFANAYLYRKGFRVRRRR